MRPGTRKLIATASTPSEHPVVVETRGHRSPAGHGAVSSFLESREPGDTALLHLLPRRDHRRTGPPGPGRRPARTGASGRQPAAAPPRPAPGRRERADELAARRGHTAGWIAPSGQPVRGRHETGTDVPGDPRAPDAQRRLPNRPVGDGQAPRSVPYAVVRDVCWDDAQTIRERSVGRIGAGSALAPVRKRSTPRAAERPSAMAHTMRDWPRPASPATKTPSTLVA